MYLEVLREEPLLVGVYIESVLDVGLYEINVVGLRVNSPCARFVIARNACEKRGDVVRLVSQSGEDNIQIDMEWLPNERPRIICRSRSPISVNSVCNVEYRVSIRE